MDGGVSSAAVEVLVQNLIDVLKQEYYLVRDVDEHVQELQKTLGTIQAYLNDAEKKSITQDAAKIWLRQLEALAFNADNVLDEFSYHLLQKKFKKMKQAPKKKVLSCFSPFKHIAHRCKIAHAIKQINTDFESMNKRASDLGLQTMIVNAPAAAPHASLETDSLSQDPIFIGRDKDVVKLVDLVNETPQERKLSIFAIVGMGGLGKTTLTREVVNHQKIKTRFGSRIWVHVSQIFDPIALFKKILSNLSSSTSTADEDESREAILKKLKEALKDKKYLLVLDDVWNEDPHKWGDFMNSISAVTSTEGNAIIMSSRKEDVASIANPLDIHSLNVLSDEDCWSIIRAKAFENREVPSPSSGFERIGRKIAKSCQGLPLAANVVGGLLLGCKTEEEWDSINENGLSDVESIFKILKLSYDHLASPSLKKCFAYCSIFPKGSKIKKQQLIEMWMAEGFLKAAGQRNEEMESVGNKFINVLLHNSLLLVSERDEYGNVESCVMHDLVHDVASFALGSSDDGITPLRYTVHVSHDRIPKQVAKHLRTLVLKGDVSGTTYSDFESLRVLTLVDYRAKELPSWIRKLTHLRLLDISKTSIKELPEWIGELHHLQTLRTHRYGMKKMPSMLGYLTNLSHLYIRFSQREFPAEIGRLTGLQTLDRFTVGDEKGYRIEELGSLKSLKGKLEICKLEKVHGKEEAEKANMSHKPDLLDLKFEWSNTREGETDNDESVLEGLQPHRNLKKLEIQRFRGNKFPSWKMPNLTSLMLRGLGKVKFINSSFTKLTSLYIDDLEGLERLPDRLFYENPNLSELEIVECPKLRELPDGMHTLISLDKLTIQKCPDLKSIGNNNNNSPWKSRGRVLCIEDCASMMELPHQMVESWAPSLKALTLVRLSSLNNLPMVIDCLAKSSTSLKWWKIYGVPHYCMATRSVESWPFGKLGRLFIDDVSEETIASVERMLQGCSSKSLRYLTLRGVEDWENIPESIQHFTALRELALENFGMEELPEWLGNLTSLYSLSLSSCKKLRRLPPGDAYKTLTRLRYLDIKECPELQLHSVRCDFPHLTIRVRSS